MIRSCLNHCYSLDHCIAYSISFQQHFSEFLFDSHWKNNLRYFKENISNYPVGYIILVCVAKLDKTKTDIV